MLGPETFDIGYAPDPAFDMAMKGQSTRRGHSSTNCLPTVDGSGPSRTGQAVVLRL